MRTSKRTLLALALALPVGVQVAQVPAVKAQEKADSTAAVEKMARDALARFVKGDPGWKVRMETLVKLTRAGRATAPVLVESLKDGSPSAREFAAQALVYLADVKARPALQKALNDPISGVRIYAIQALSMLGPLPRTELHEWILANDPNEHSVRSLMATALERDDQPRPGALRKVLADYDLRNLESARIGKLAPDFTLTDSKGKTYRLSQFRGKQMVVLRFPLFDF
jgi:hypothetical protein